MSALSVSQRRVVSKFVKNRAQSSSQVSIVELSRKIGYKVKDVRNIVNKIEQEENAIDLSTPVNQVTSSTLPLMATHEVADCSPSEVVVPHNAKWEACVVLCWHGFNCDIQMFADGEVIHAVPNQFVRQLRKRRCSRPATHEVADCSPSEVVVPRNATWEPCVVLCWHDVTCDIQIFADGEVVHAVPNQFVRKLQKQTNKRKRTVTPASDQTTEDPAVTPSSQMITTPAATPSNQTTEDPAVTPPSQMITTPAVNPFNQITVVPDATPPSQTTVSPESNPDTPGEKPFDFPQG